MFHDDLLLVAEMVAKYSAKPPYVEAGGLENPTIAAYEKTIEAVADYRRRVAAFIAGESDVKPGEPQDEIRAAQMCRYLQIHRPLEASCPGYALEDPSTGGVPLESLATKYRPDMGTGIGTAILLSVLEHVADPFVAVDGLRDAMATGGLAIASVPWAFPTHYGPEDNWRISASGLRHIFGAPAGEPRRWEILECGDRLNIPAEAGILDQHGRAQIVQSAFIVARAIG